MNKQSGSGLLETILMSTVFLILVQNIFQFQSNVANAIKADRIKTSASVLKHQILGKMDCGETIMAIDPNWKSCVVGQRITIYSRDTSNHIFINGSGNYTIIDDFQVRSFCRPCVNCWIADTEISFEYRMMDVNNNIKKHLLHKDDRWTPMFRDGELHCQFLH